MIQNFDSAFEQIIGVEGGYVNDPNDSGGETRYGISKKSYPNEDIKNLTLNRAKSLYKQDYWDKVKGDLLPPPLDIFMFDAAVNQGVDAAIKTLQKSLGVAQDGILGKDTMNKAINARQDLCCTFMAERAVKYTGTRGADKYLRGWLRRLFIITMGAK